MVNFLIAVFSSIAASLLLFGLTRWRSPILVGRLSSATLFGHGVEYSYRNQDHARRDMIKDLRASPIVRILCMRGYSLTQREQAFNFVLQDRSKDVCLLFADPGDSPGDNPNIARRATEYGPDPDTYRNYIITSVKEALAAIERNDRVKCRLHHDPACVRLYVTSTRAFVSFFTPGVPATAARITSIKAGSPLYEGFLRYFEQTWERSRDASDLHLQ